MLRYLQVLPVAVVLWGLDAVDQFRAGAQVAGLRHAVAVAHISHHLGGAIAQPMNHWLAANTVLAGVVIVMAQACRAGAGLVFPAAAGPGAARRVIRG